MHLTTYLNFSIRSDCPQPHFPHSVNILFHRATIIKVGNCKFHQRYILVILNLLYFKQVSIFVDFNQDESYTPKQISIRGGTTFRDLQVSIFTGMRTIFYQTSDTLPIGDNSVRM